MTLFATLLSVGHLGLSGLPVANGPAISSVAPLADSTPVHLGISLKLTHSAELDAYRKAQQDPTSPSYHQWLEPTEFGTRFGQSSKVYAQAVAWLKGAGFEVTEFPNHIFVEGRGTAAQVTKLLGVHLLPVAGQQYAHMPDGKPELPAALAPYILHISGLDTRVHFHHHLAEAGGAPAAMGPQDLRNEYGAQPLLDQGFYGQGQQLVVLAEAEPPGASTEIDPATIQYFYQNASDAKAQLIFDTLANPGMDFDPTGGGSTEFELDAEMQSVGSPGATSITLVIPPASEVFTTGANEIASNLSSATAVSISLGTCEPAEEQDPTELQALEQSVIQGTVEGQTWSAASGDSGSDDCQDGMTQAIDFPADLPEIVAAGGSMLPQANPFDANNGILTYVDEVTWNDPTTQGIPGGAGGGGISTLLPAPSYQSAFGFSGRSVPDIALIAGQPGAASDTGQVGILFPVEGTSVASPLSAGFFGLIASRVGCRLGDPHAALYAMGLAMFDGGPQVYNDITLGTVSLNGVPGPDAGVGYDSATGWGSLNVAAMAAAWPNCAPQFYDAGVDGGAVDAGPVADGGTAGPAYDACSFIACAAPSICATVVEGPAGCISVCDVRVDGGCALGTICSNQTLFTDGGIGSCVPGCLSAADCFADAGGASLCDDCTETCVVPGTASATVGQACNVDSDCPTGGNCLADMGFFPNGYCSTVCDPLNLEICTCPPDSTCIDFGEGSGQCLTSCPSPGFGCNRSGYACQPQIGASPVCLPACTVQSFGGQTFDTCTILYGGDAGCDIDSGVCGGPMPIVPDAGLDAGPDAGPDAGVDAGPVTGPDAGVDAGLPGADAGALDAGPDAGSEVADGGAVLNPSSGCGCTPGVGSPDLAFVVIALGGMLRRKRRK